MSAEGVMKSALLLMSIGEEEAAQVFKFLGPREVQKIGVAMAALKNITREQIDEVLQEFVREAEKHTALSLDSSDYIRSVLTKALGDDKAGAIIDRILQGSDTSGIEGLKWMDSAAVAELIKNEHPQIIATILVHLDRDQASEIVACFTERLRNDVLLRIATLDGIQPAALRELDDVLTGLLSGSDNLKASARRPKFSTSCRATMKKASSRTFANTTRNSRRRSSIRCLCSRTCSISRTVRSSCC
jgi:flagellar motor switch protein FliG